MLSTVMQYLLTNYKPESLSSLIEYFLKKKLILLKVEYKLISFSQP
jgi:hypothetical protein